MNLEELLNDAEFASQVEAIKDDPEAMAKLFNEKGIEVTAEDFRQAMEMMEKEELTEAELEDVAGGGAISVLWQILDRLRHPLPLPIPPVPRPGIPVPVMKKSKKSKKSK